MNGISVEKTRNIVVLGHASCGKTSLVEAMLFRSGTTSRMGTVETKSTVSDCMPEEQERQVSIMGSNLFLKHRDHNIFVGDTPGYADFYADVSGAISVADAAIVVIDASHGVEVGTRKIWRILEERNIPRMIVLNKMDRENAKFTEIVAELNKSFGNGCTPIQVPIGLAETFTDAANLLLDEAGEADAEMFNDLKTQLIETAVESDEAMMERYFNDETLTREEIIHALHKGIHNCTFFPIVLASATKPTGIVRLLNCVVDYMPSPIERGEIEAEVEEGGPLNPDSSLPSAALVFKTVTDPFVGQLTYMRVYQGTITSGKDVHNFARNHKERIGELMIIQGKEQIHVDSASPGDIVAVAKLKDTHVNDALGEAKVKFKDIVFPKPVTTVAVTAAKRGQEEKIAEGLHRINEEDPTIRVERHPETHELLVSGLGDVHLDVVLKRLKEKFKVDVNTSTPKVAYHETIRGTADVRYRHRKQSGGAGQFAEVAIKIRPNERDVGYEFVNKIVGGVISSSFIPSVDKGIQARMKEGIIAGCPVVDVVVELYDGKEHPVDSKDIAFQIAGKHVIVEAIEKAKPILLEPIVNVEVGIPQEFLGDINAIINSKRGHITGMDTEGSMQIIKSQVPHAEMFRFCSELRSITGGRGSFSIEFDHYAEVPPNTAKTVIDAYKKSRNQDED